MKEDEDKNESDNEDDDEKEDGDENESDNEDEEEVARKTYDLWNYLRNKATNDETIQAQYEEVKEKLQDEELSDEEVGKQASRVIKPDIRKHIYDHCINFLTLWHYAKEDETYKQIMRTKRKLIEEEDFGPVEAIMQAVKKRKVLIQKATGTLDDDPLEEKLPLPTMTEEEDTDEEDEEESDETD